ncbi:uncharacterized protein LOC144350905 [Saccoglossus kowalevskii]
MPFRTNKWARPKKYYRKLHERKKLEKLSTEDGIINHQNKEDVCIREPEPFTFSYLKQHVNEVSLPLSWSLLSSCSEFRFSKVEFIGDVSKVSRCVMVAGNLTWRVLIHGRDVTSGHDIFEHVPQTITALSVITQLITLVNTCNICMGNTDQAFIDLVQSRGGEIVKSVSFAGEKEVSAYIEEDYNAKAEDGTIYNSTIRSVDCILITDRKRCCKCSSYRSNLRSLSSRRKSQGKEQNMCTDTNSKANFRYLDKTQLHARATNLQRERSNVKKSLDRIVKRLISTEGISVEKPLQSDLKTIMEVHSKDVTKAYSEDSFQRLFWEEQLRHAKCADSRQMRWHPTIIRWCLSLRY